MLKNSISFQKGLSIPKFMKIYGIEIQCRERLFYLRCENDYVCPDCTSKSYCELKY